MEYLNLSSWQQNASISSAEMAKNYARNMVHIRSLAASLLSMIGIWCRSSCGADRHMVRIVIWYRSSCGADRHMVQIVMSCRSSCGADRHMVQIVIWVGQMTITFSVMLLALVSIERLLAFTRPHTLSLRARRAKITLVIIT